MDLRIGYEDYDLVIDDGVVSCVGYFDLPNSSEIRVKPEPRKEYKRMTLMEDDFGPQKFCKLCNCKLEVLWDSSNDCYVYFHTESEECDLYGILDEDKYWSGIQNSEPMTIERTRNSWNKIKETKWFKENKNELKRIYIENRDSRGKDPMESNEDMDEEIKSKSIDWEAPTSTENTKAYTRAENKFLRFYVKYVMSWLYGKRDMRVLIKEAFEAGKIRESLYETCLELAEYIRDNHIWHPRTERWYKYKDLQNWEQIERAIAKEEAFLNKDWELESRKTLNYVHY